MTRTEFQNPETLEEWQDVADFAHVLLSLDSARQFGLVTGGPDVNVDRCTELLRLAIGHGIEPSEDAVPRIMPALLQESMS